MKEKRCPVKKSCFDYKNNDCDQCDFGKEFANLHRKIDRQKWIAVAERLPKKSGAYLTFTKGVMMVMDFSKKHGKFNAYDMFETAESAIPVTHWMPLPKPPKGDQK